MATDVENCRLHTIRLHLQELQEITERRYLEGISEENPWLTEDYALALQLQAEFMSDRVADEIDEFMVDKSDEPGKDSTPPTPGPGNSAPNPSLSTSTQEVVPSDDLNHRLNTIDVAHNAQMLEVLKRIDHISAILGACNEVIQEQCATSSAVCSRVDELTRSYNTVIEALNSSLNQQFNENQSVRGEVLELREMVQSLRRAVANASGDNDRDVLAPNANARSGGTSQHRISTASANTCAITSQRTGTNRNLPSVPALVNGGYPVRVDPVRFGRSTNYDTMARKIVKSVYRPSGLSARLRGYREGPTTLLLMWKTEVDARTFFEAWHEVDHEDEWADVSVSLDFLI
ncbi:hypothetical protein E1B28_003547 [Marasmius oreades]|uniref:Uncharacterized protein n=1 Tax=Marasmius oreades TaxID=181124 RepID=A0A9P7RM65_9AGAR|nr:uncharacterized protein E1B28_003547 [Marasmius oreades]KAG7086025.1 hypothetical protein E1B28_003547 [Marasmius oreades]